MRFAVFVFSILLIFSTTYAHALAFVPAAVGGLVRMAGGQVMKVASKKGLLYTAGGAAIFNYCKKNQKKCKDIIGDTLGDYFFDDDVYRYKVMGYEKYKNYNSFRQACNAVNHEDVISVSMYQNYNVKSYRERSLRGDDDDLKYCDFIYDKRNFGIETRSLAIQKYKVSDEERQKNNEQLAKKIAEKLSDDDIDQIINNYSKEIEINIDKYCATAGACAELEQSFGDEVMNNKNKYDIDKINKDNCEVRDGKITSCDKAKKDTDDDDSDTPKDPKKPKDGDDGQDRQDGQDDDSDDTKPKDKPINCEASAFHKKVCDFIDWYQSDDYEKTDNKINIQDDTPKPTNTNIEFSGSCPASYVVSHTLHFGMLGSYDFEFTLLDTPKLCTFLNDWIKPIMMFLGPLHATYIIGKRDE